MVTNKNTLHVLYLCFKGLSIWTEILRRGQRKSSISAKRVTAIRFFMKTPLSFDFIYATQLTAGAGDGLAQTMFRTHIITISNVICRRQTRSAVSAAEVWHGTQAGCQAAAAAVPSSIPPGMQLLHLILIFILFYFYNFVAE